MKRVIFGRVTFGRVTFGRVTFGRVTFEIVAFDIVALEKVTFGWPMRGLETDHVISGPKRGLKKCMGRGHQTHRHTEGHCNLQTDAAQRAESVREQKNPICLVVRSFKVGRGTFLIP